MFKIGKFQGVIIEDNGFPWNSRGCDKKWCGIPGGGGVVKNEIEFQGGMTSENGYPQQGGYEKFLEKPISIRSKIY